MAKRRVKDAVVSEPAFEPSPEFQSEAEVFVAFLLQHGKPQTKAQKEIRHVAWEYMSDLVASGSPRAWPTVHRLLKACQSQAELMYVAAGPLEDLLRRSPIDKFLLGTIEMAALKDPRIRLALAGVWFGTGREDQAVFEWWEQVRRRYGVPPDGSVLPLATP